MAATVTAVPEYETMSVWDVDFSTGSDGVISHSLGSTRLNVSVINLTDPTTPAPTVVFTDQNTMTLNNATFGATYRVFIQVVPQ